MQKIIAISFFIAALLSCKDDITKINKRGIIPEEDFIEILAGIHLIDAITEGPDFNSRFEVGDSVILYGAIFEKYNVTKVQFDSTVNMYIRQPDVYLKVYDKVLLKLNYMLDTLRNNDPKFSNEIPEK